MMTMLRVARRRSTRLKLHWMSGDLDTTLHVGKRVPVDSPEPVWCARLQHEDVSRAHLSGQPAYNPVLAPNEVRVG